MKDKQQQLQAWIDESQNIVFFGGAGVSTESGIPDFRSVDGLYHQSYEYPPETIISHSFFEENPMEFYRFYIDRMLFPKAHPNAAHHKLTQLEQIGKLSAVVTQNIDGLHQRAGSQTVYELHGSVHRNYCMHCHKSYSLDFLLSCKDIPRCTCGGIVRPDVVLYEESLNSATLSSAITAIEAADMLIIGGTSLAVYPAASLIHYFHGSRLAIINKTPTPYDQKSCLVIAAPIGQVLGAVSC